MKNQKGVQTGKLHDSLNSKFSKEGNYSFIKRLEVYHNTEGIFGLFPFFNNHKLDKNVLESSFYNDFKSNFEFNVMSSNVTKGLTTNHIAIEFKHGEVITGIKGHYDEENKRILALKITTNISSYTLGKTTTLNQKNIFSIGKENCFIPGFKTAYMTDKSQCFLSFIGVYFESNTNYETKYFTDPKESRLWKNIENLIKKVDKFIYSISRFIFILFLIFFPFLYYYSKSQNIYGGNINVISPRDKDFLTNNTQIHTDENGFTHIKAENLYDAMFSLGFAHARDRLFQIDFIRRLASGRLSELMGEKTLKIDVMIRKMGLAKINEQKASYFQSTKSYKYYTKYIQGINYYATNFKLPVEYILLNHGFTEFTPIDIVAITNYMSLELTEDWSSEIIHKYLEEHLGKEFADLVSSIKSFEIPLGNSTIINEEELIELGLSIKEKAGAKVFDEIDESKILELKTKKQKVKQEETNKAVNNEVESKNTTEELKESDTKVDTDADLNKETDQEKIIVEKEIGDNTVTQTITETTDLDDKQAGKEAIKDAEVANEQVSSDFVVPVKDDEPSENSSREKSNHNPSHYSKVSDSLSLDTFPTNQGASNSWVISGKLTTSGYPLLSNDPHLSNGIPSLSYAAKIYLPDNIISGITLPGTPAFISGSTNNIAWGLTSENNDISDLCEEIIQDEFYLFKDKKFPIVKTEETILIKGRTEPEYIEVQWTKNGPLINEIIEELNPVKLPYSSMTPFSFRISWYLTSEFSLDLMFSLYRAKHINEIQRSINRFVSPTQNVVWANIKGDIGYFRTGKMLIKDPLASNLGKKTFCKGWKAQDDYKEFLDPKDYPNITNPRKGYVVTANNRMTSENYIHDYNGAHIYARAYRIREMIEKKVTKKNVDEAKISIEDSMEFLKDVKEVYAEFIVPKLIEIYERNKKKEYEEFRSYVTKMQEYQQIQQSNPDFQVPESKYAPPESIVYLEHLRKWNYTMEYDSYYATLYTVLEYNIGYNLLLPMKHDVILGILSHRPFFNFIYSLIEKVHQGKKVDLKACSYLTGSKNCEKYLVRIIDNFGKYITEESTSYKGNVIVYGEIAKQFYPSLLFDSIPILKNFFSKEINSRGNRNTVKVSVNRYNLENGKFYSIHSPVSQFVVDMKNPNEPMVNIQTGNSGNIFSKYYNNRIDKTDNAELVKFENYSFPEGANSNTILLVKK